MEKHSMFDKMEWYTKHAKKLDKKYYAKGESIYVLHRRTLQTAKSIIDLINDIPADDLFLELYMLPLSSPVTNLLT